METCIATNLENPASNSLTTSGFMFPLRKWEIVENNKTHNKSFAYKEFVGKSIARVDMRSLPLTKPLGWTTMAITLLQFKITVLPHGSRPKKKKIMSKLINSLWGKNLKWWFAFLMRSIALGTGPIGYLDHMFRTHSFWDVAWGNLHVPLSRSSTAITIIHLHFPKQQLMRCFLISNRN